MTGKKFQTFADYVFIKIRQIIDIKLTLWGFFEFRSEDPRTDFPKFTSNFTIFNEILFVLDIETILP